MTYHDFPIIYPWQFTMIYLQKLLEGIPLPSSALQNGALTVRQFVLATPHHCSQLLQHLSLPNARQIVPNNHPQNGSKFTLFPALNKTNSKFFGLRVSILL
jgi:hypothetical protein